MTQRTPGSPGPPFASDSPADRVDISQNVPIELDPAALATLVLACPGVVAMHGGVAGEAATYLPGRRVVGVRILPDGVQVHVVSRWPTPASEVAAQVWAATARAVAGKRVDVIIGDVLLPTVGAVP